MKITLKRVVIGVVMLVSLTIAGFAYGGGGVFQSHQMLFEGYTNAGIAAETHGGYGYGAGRGGRRYGGFGLAVTDSQTEAFLGGFGGVMTGHQFRTGPLTMSANLYSGIGHATAALLPEPSPVAFFVEASAEVGFAVLPWLQISLFGGYQAIGSLDPSTMFMNTTYAPVLGSRLTWGSF